MRVLVLAIGLAAAAGGARADEGCAIAARAAIARADGLPCAEAWDVYEHALECEDVTEVLAGRARARQSRCLSRQGRHEDAADYADWALHLMPRERSILLLHARMMMAAGQFEAALASLSTARKQSAAAAELSLPIDVAVRGRVFPVRPGFAPDDLPQSRSIAELLAHLPGDIAEPAGLSDQDILGEVEERTWAAQFRLEDAVTDRAQGAVAEEDALVAAMVAATAPPELQALHDTHQALLLLAKGLRGYLGHPARPPGLGHFTATPVPDGLRAAIVAGDMRSDEAVEAVRRVRAAFRDGDLRLLDRVVGYPLTVVLPSGKAVEVGSMGALGGARAAILSPHLRSRVLAEGLGALAVSGDRLDLAQGRVVLAGQDDPKVVWIDTR